MGAPRWRQDHALCPRAATCCEIISIALSRVLAPRIQCEFGGNMAGRYWVEATRVEGRLPGEWAIGRRLWSPECSKSNHDIYRAMREVAPGDAVLHVDVGRRHVIGVSVAAGRFRPVDTLPEGCEWAGRPGMAVEVEQFEPIDPPIPFSTFLSLDQSPQVEAIIRDAREQFSRSGTPQLFFTEHPSAVGDRKLRQGAYLSEVPASLIRHIDACVTARGMNGLPTPWRNEPAQVLVESRGEDSRHQPGLLPGSSWDLVLQAPREVDSASGLARLLVALDVVAQGLAALSGDARTASNDSMNCAHVRLDSVTLRPLCIRLSVADLSGEPRQARSRADQALTRASMASLGSAAGDPLLLEVAKALADVDLALEAQGSRGSYSLGTAEPPTAARASSKH